MTTITENGGPQLPQELINLIIEFLRDEKIPLIQCCLVSRSWEPQARQFLWETVRLDSRSRNIWSLHDDPDSEPIEASLPYGIPIPSIVFIKLLVSSPSLSAIVRHLRISPSLHHAFGQGDDVLPCYSVHPLIVPIVAMLSNLETLSFDGNYSWRSDDFFLPRPIRSSLQQILMLSTMRAIHLILREGRFPASLFKCIANIDRLTLDQASLVQLDRKPSQRRAQPVFLTLSMPKVVPAPVFPATLINYVDLSHVSTLHLNIGISSPSTIPLLTPLIRDVAGTLECLQLWVFITQVQRQEVDLSRCKKLRSLDISTSSVGPSGSGYIAEESNSLVWLAHTISSTSSLGVERIRMHLGLDIRNTGVLNGVPGLALEYWRSVDAALTSGERRELRSVVILARWIEYFMDENSKPQHGRTERFLREQFVSVVGRGLFQVKWG